MSQYEFSHHKDCPKCGSKDNVGVYTKELKLKNTVLVLPVVTAKVTITK